MPNWVRNRMTVKFEKDTFKATGNGMQILNFIMKPLCTEECVFDFEKLIPIPDSYYADYDPSKTLYPSSALSERALQDYSDYVGMGKMPENMDAERHKAMFTIGKQSYDNYQRYGAANWYDWCCKYWGTKWDACHAERTEREDCVEIIFDTAWSTPTGIWERLFKYLQVISALRRILRIAIVSQGILMSGVQVIVRDSIRMKTEIITTIARNTAVTVTSALLIAETEEQ